MDFYATNESFLGQLKIEKTENTLCPAITHSSVLGNSFSHSILMAN